MMAWNPAGLLPIDHDSSPAPPGVAFAFRAAGGDRSMTKNTHIGFRAPESSVKSWRSMAAACGQSLSAWIVQSLDETPRVFRPRVRAGAASRATSRNARRGAPGQISMS